MIIIDLWNTIARKNKSFSGALHRQLGVPTPENYRLFESSMMQKEWSSMDDMAMSFLESMGLEKSRRNISIVVKAEKDVIQYATPIEGMKELMQELHKKRSVVLLSNATCFTNQLIHKWGFDEYLERVFFSWQIGRLKPDPKSYLHVCKEMSVRPEECLFIDDNKENCKAAASLGMDVIRFSSVEQLKEQLRKRKLLS